MLVAEADLHGSRLAQDHRHDKVDEKSNDNDQIERRMMPAQFPLNPEMRGDITLNTSRREFGVSGHNELVSILPNTMSRHLRRWWQNITIFQHNAMSLWV